MQELPPILVAEDDDDDFLLLRRALRDALLDNPLLRFRDGAELIRFLEQIPVKEMGPVGRCPWLLLLDITMPIVNGFGVLDWLGKHRISPRLRPVMLSGSYRKADIDRSMALGAVDYLVKPVTPQILAAIATRQMVPTVRA
jgi:CheY-like chemotaxis protein